MWLATKNYAQGLFYEPRFYGQDYNSMIEALLSVPLYKLGIPLHIALPITTTLFTLFPVFLLAVLTYRKKSKIAGIILLCLFLTLSFEYDLITSMPRGFVTGIAFSALIFLFMDHDNYFSYLSIPLIAILSYYINENSILICTPLVFLLFLKNHKKKKFYVCFTAGLLIGLFVHWLIERFYANNSHYIVHSYKLELSFASLKEGLLHLDMFFDQVSPALWKQGSLILVLFLLMAMLFYKTKKNDHAIISLFIPFMLLAPLLVSKVHDGTDSVFFSYSRMYLAVPIIVLLFVSWIEFKNRKWAYLFTIIAVFFLSIKISNAKAFIEKNMNKNHVVSTINIKKLYKECAGLFSIATGNNIDLIIIVDHWNYDFYNYACPACIKQFPKTLRPAYERRTWRLVEDENKVYSNVLLIDLKRKLDEESVFISEIKEKKGLYIIKNNKLTTEVLLKKLKISTRPFKMAHTYPK